MDNLLKVTNLKKYFPVEKGFLDRLLTSQKNFVHAVDDVSFSVNRGDILGLVGESGSGKSTTGRLCLKLVEPTSGSILFERVDVAKLHGEELRRFRKNMQLIFQDPMSSLSPRIKLGDAIRHALSFQGVGTASEQTERTRAILERVGLKPWSNFYDRYPHQLSGGQRQRVVIARALVLNPKFVVADEPIAMVDVSVRAQILELMLELKKEFDLTYLFITHDLAMANYVCHSIAIMYLGKIVETGSKEDVFGRPLHPYTLALLSSIPVPDPKAKLERIIPKGEIPSPINPPKGCRFHPRCPYAQNICSEREPQLEEIKPQRYAACFFPRHS
ncbi:MAG: ABC transporter ATP-binding protein [Candidatus Bathyarchaeia archaeon]